jgi:hypothetical protein
MAGFDDTMTRYTGNFGRSLYDDMKKLEQTESSLIKRDNGAYKPLIFTLSFEGKRKTIRSFTIVFFDTAGEDLKKADAMNTVTRYIGQSSGIIFLIDPLQIQNVRDRLDEDTVSRASPVANTSETETEQVEILKRVSELIQDAQRLSKNDKIGLPMAAVFAKLDAIEPLIPPGSTIREQSPHCEAGAFVMSDWHNVNIEIEDLLRGWDAGPFVNALKIRYKNYSFFAASALGFGNSPWIDGRIKERPKPHRIEDAVLWILKENGVIKAKKDKTKSLISMVRRLAHRFAGK